MHKIGNLQNVKFSNNIETLVCILCVLLWYDIFFVVLMFAWPDQNSLKPYPLLNLLVFTNDSFNCRCPTPLRLGRRRRGIWSTLHRQGLPTGHLWWFVSFCIVVTFYIMCFTLYIKDIHRSHDLAKHNSSNIW